MYEAQLDEASSYLKKPNKLTLPNWANYEPEPEHRTCWPPHAESQAVWHGSASPTTHHVQYFALSSMTLYALLARLISGSAGRG